MKKIIVVTLLPLLYFLIACSNQSDSNYAGYRKYTPKDSSYIISYPETWDARRGRRSFQLMLISPKTDSADAFQENVIIFREDMSIDHTLKDFVDETIQEKLPKSLKDFKLLKKESVKINGEDAYRLEYTFSYRMPVRSVGYIFDKEGFAYVVLGTAPDSTFASYSNIFDNIGKSFKFLDKK